MCVFICVYRVGVGRRQWRSNSNDANKPPINVSKSLTQKGQLTVTCTGKEKAVSHPPPPLKEEAPKNCGFDKKHVPLPRFYIKIVGIFFSTIFYCGSSTVVSIFLPPLPPTPATPTSHPWSCPTFGFVHVSFIHVPDNTSPFSPIIPSHLPSGYYCQFVLKTTMRYHFTLVRMAIITKSIQLWEFIFKSSLLKFLCLEK